MIMFSNPLLTLATGVYIGYAMFRQKPGADPAEQEAHERAMAALRANQAKRQ